MTSIAPQLPSLFGIERGRLLILAAAILWSLAGVFIKFLDIHPLAIVFYRSLFAALVFTPFLKRRDFHVQWHDSGFGLDLHRGDQRVCLGQ